MTRLAYGFATAGYRPIEARERLGSAGVAALLLALLLALALIRYQPALVTTPVPRLPVNFIPLPPEPVPPRVPPKREKALPDSGGTPAPRAARPQPQRSGAPARPAPAPPNPSPAPVATQMLLAPPAPPPAVAPASGTLGNAAAEGTRPAGGTGGDGRGIAGTGSGTGRGDGAGNSLTMVRAEWVRMATWEEVYEFHPRAAKVARQSGDVRLRCKVTLNRRLVDCLVMSESPQGWGFGDGALALSRRLRAYPRKIDGVEVDRAWVFFTVKFDPPLETK